MKKLILFILLATACFAQVQGPPQPFTGSLTAANSGCIAASCLSLQVPADASTATIQLTGTWTATVQFEVSADNQTTWNSISAQPVPSGAQVSSSTANGLWQVGIAGFTNLRIRVSAYTSGTVSALVDLVFGQTAVMFNPVDPCASPQIAKQSFLVNISSATTTAIQAGATGKTVYVCAFTLIYTSGTTPTAKFEYGTGGACGTGTTALTGTMAIPATAGQGIIAGAGHTMFAGASSNDVCIVSAGTTPNYQGWITYVQQ